MRAAALLVALALPAAAQDAAPLVIESEDEALGLYPSDVAEARVRTFGGGYPLVEVRLVPEAADRLADLTRGRLGERFTVRFCGVMLMEPELRSELDRGVLAIVGEGARQGPLIVSILEGREPCAAQAF